MSLFCEYNFYICLYLYWVQVIVGTVSGAACIGGGVVDATALANDVAAVEASAAVKKEQKAMKTWRRNEAGRGIFVNILKE